jgi:hypothetical protein
LSQEPGKHRSRDKWGPQEVIALVVVIMAFGLAIIALIMDKPEASVPAWVVALVGGVGVYYFKNGKSSGD